MKIYFAGKEYKGVSERKKYLLGLRCRLVSFYNYEVLRYFNEIFKNNSKNSKEIIYNKNKKTKLKEEKDEI